jgi:methionyl-tRNA formyltransferase
MKIIVIGNGKMATDCIRWMLMSESHTIAHIFYENEKNVNPRVLLELIESHHLPSSTIVKIHDEANLKVMQSISPDWIFNINSYQYLRESVLSIPKNGVINFHNGPLPRYGGVNIPSWAIINGEAQHGVTWHLVNTEIDAGEVLSQAHFELTARMTAAQLMVKCIQVGLQLFEQHWADWVEGKVQPTSQQGERLYFGLKDKVPNGGLLTKNQTSAHWDKMIRGLHLFPYPNEFGFAHILLDQKKYYVIAGRKWEEELEGEWGTFVVLENKGFVIQLCDGPFLVTQLADAQWRLVKPNAMNIGWNTSQFPTIEGE